MQQREVAVMVILRRTGDDIEFLLVYDDSWGGLTLPMTTRRTWREPELDVVGREPWQDAAARAYLRALGRPIAGDLPCCLERYGVVQLSQSEGAYQSYDFRVYISQEPPGAEALAGTIHAWLTADQVEQVKPVSPTAIHLLGELNAAHRVSVSSVAWIARDGAHGVEYLAQWNRKWRCYFAVGGHRRGSGDDEHEPETDRECLVRELAEELGLTEDEVNVPPEPRQTLEYTAASLSSNEQTRFILAAFEVVLASDEARDKVAQNDQNRWLTREEVRTGVTVDGQPISSTMLRLLDELG